VYAVVLTGILPGTKIANHIVSRKSLNFSQSDEQLEKFVRLIPR
jgi:hypothetical protein